MRFLFVLAVSAGLPFAAWAADDPAETACHQKDTTLAIVACLDGLTSQWDKRLNAAYQAVAKSSENDARKTGLTQAERAWLAFRKADCGWYGAQDGTIREIAGVQCMLDLTRARAMELQENVPR